MRKLLIANRGEVAIRVARAAADLAIPSVGVFSEDDATSLHVRVVDEARPLTGVGPRAYLDADQLLGVARDLGCDGVHPGYGFLAENAGFARQCAEVGLVFVGPSPETLAVFGDKVAARALARECDVPVLEGSTGATTLAEARRMLDRQGQGGAVMVKALAGGGGRGMRPVSDPEQLEEAFTRCASEAASAFGDDRVYVETFLPRARHVEVQMVGDGHDVVHLWDRECSLQRQRQKLVEMAPAVQVPEDTREALLAAATRLARAAELRSLCTVEFLVPVPSGEGDPVPTAGPDGLAFIEANARLQVEHTVTEEVTGVDLVAVQLQLASGARLAEVGLTEESRPPPRGIALQARVNLETMSPDGTPRPAGGTISVYEPPSGPGVRVDGCGYAGYRPPTTFDSLLAKVVVHAPAGGVPAAVQKAYRALTEFRLDGVASNIGFLESLLQQPAVIAGDVDTRYIERHLAELGTSDAEHRQRFFDPGDPAGPDRRTTRAGSGRRIDPDDPLAVLTYGQDGRQAGGATATAEEPPEGLAAVRAPLQGTVIEVQASAGDTVAAGQVLVVVEAMKMEHLVTADQAGVVTEVRVAPGDTLFEDDIVAYLEPSDAGEGSRRADAEAVDLDLIRPDLAEVIDRHRRVLDETRPDAVERRRRFSKRTARENVEDLCDPGTFTEYGPLVVAGRSGRNTPEELIAQTPADGLIMGLAQINGAHFGPERARAAVMSYDYTVLAGTQGARNHVKMDRMAELALRWRLPTVFFTEGGGGRPGDTDRGSGFIRGFELWAQLSGKVPLVGITSGRCFAGNAAVLGCCDVIIATRDSALGMGGPAMVEGGGLGVYRPEEIGPLSVMQDNGVIDVLVDDEAAAVAAGQQYLAYFQGRLSEWSCADQRLLRHVVPENRLRAYDVRRVIELLADDGSVMELRPRFGRAMIAALIRIEGRPVGLIANNPSYLGGAIDSDASDKAARFLQLCEAFDLPVVSLSDTPGNMVGPEAEKSALIRHCSRLFVIGANLTVPIFSVVLRKSYGLGAIAMTGGSYQKASFVVSWPTGEFGGMGLEGSVKLGYRNELAAIDDPAERQATFDRMVAEAYESGKALSRATHPALDDVIDPADTRRWIAAGLDALPPTPVRTQPKVPWIDAW